MLCHICILRTTGYIVHKFYNGLDALNFFIETANLDLTVLDVIRPDINGFHICRKIREKHFCHIIMLTVIGKAISAETVADETGGITNELLSRLGRRLKILTVGE